MVRAPRSLVHAAIERKEVPLKATQQRLIVVTKLPAPVLELIKTAQAIVTALTGNANFPNPTPTLAAITAAIAALDTAETATKTRAKGTVPVRNAARTTLIADLHAIKSYVQQIADANVDNAEAIITSAGMAVRKPSTRTKAPFAAKAGDVSGTVKLAAKAAAQRASYDWEWSSDGGKTWTQVPSTLQAKTTISGLPVATTVLFRFRFVVKAGEGDWSQPLSFVVK
jgi:hypothetical protein